MSLISAAILLFLILDPVGNIPAFVCILQAVPPTRRKPVIVRELLIALLILILFLFFGRYVLTLLQISQSSLGIAGGIILFLIAVKMIFAGAAAVFPNTTEGEPLIVPLAVPFIAGPSAMTAVIVLMARDPARWPEWLAALICAWLASSVILLFSELLARLLGHKILTAAERLMGMLLTMVAVEMFLNGIHQAFS